MSNNFNVATGDINKVHEGVDQGVGDLRGGQPLHGLWHPLPTPLGRNLCLGAPLTWHQCINDATLSKNVNLQSPPPNAFL